MGGNQLHQLTYQMYFRDGTLSSYAILTQIIPLFVGTALGGFGRQTGEKRIVDLAITGNHRCLCLSLSGRNQEIQFFGSRCRSSQTTSPSVWRSTLGGWLRMQSTTKNGGLGIRNEGSVYATYSMLRKIAQGFGQSFIPAAITILIPTLDVKDAFTWTSENALAIRDMAVLFPLIGYIIIFICFKFIFNLDRKTVTEMQVALGRDEE